MQRWKGRIAVVTGASSGIGAAIAKDLLNAGLVVAALAPCKEIMDKIHCVLDKKVQEQYHPIQCDVSDLKSVTTAFDTIEKDLCGVDILVNNAGVLSPGQIVTHDVAELQRVLQTNVMGVVHCTQRAYKSMMKREFDGHIVLVNSILGHNIFGPVQGALPELNTYPVSKFAITAMAEILRQEMRDLCTRIKITSVSPGFVKTDIELPEYCKYFNMLNPEDISGGVMYAIGTPPHVQVHELTIKPIGEMV